MRAEAHHGMVLLSENASEHHTLVPRDDAVELLASLASAIHLSGDISDPKGVWLAEEVRKAVEVFKWKGPGHGPK